MSASPHPGTTDTPREAQLRSNLIGVSFLKTIIITANISITQTDKHHSAAAMKILNVKSVSQISISN